MLSRFHHVIASSVLIAAIVSMGGCNKASSPSGADNAVKQGSVSDAKSKGGEDITAAAPKFSLKAEAFAAEVKKDASAASEKYKNAVVELTGTVNVIGHNPDQAYITLKIPNSFLGVQCFMVDKEPWAKVLPDQTIKLKGKSGDMQMNDGVLQQCVIVDAGKDHPPTVKAEAFTKEYLADRTAANKKFHDKWVIVEGEVAESGMNKQGVLMLWLKGDGKTRLNCAFGFDDKKQVEALKAGEKVKLVGKASLYTHETDEPFINSCMLITGAK